MHPADDWVVVVLDCCDAPVGVRALQHALTGSDQGTAGWAGLATTAEGTAFCGRFADALDRILGRLKGNDKAIGVGDLLHDVNEELGAVENAPSFIHLPRNASIPNPGRLPDPVIAPLDVLETLDALAPELRSHFLAKARGTELNEAGWYFSGRAREMRRVVGWLRDSERGMLVVTGVAGAGKSALLGHLVVLADDRLRVLLAESGLVDRPVDELPEPDAFDAVLHLTGKTLEACCEEAAACFDLPPTTDPRALIGALARHAGLRTILVDALDEAAEPVRIAASLLRPLAATAGTRVIVGTRGSLLEGPDLPEPETRELLDVLDARDVVVVAPDPAATSAYVAARLTGAPGSPYADERELARAVGRLVADRGQPFLFARLVVTELLARRAPASDDELAALVDTDHRGVFAAALDRIQRTSPASAAFVRALARALGRGFPRAGAIWVDVTAALHPEIALDERTLDRALADVAPFVTIDAEDGQATYRLAHKTFAEHVVAEEAADALTPTEAHRRTGETLIELVERRGGWTAAHPYVLRHLPEHARLGGMLAALDDDALDHLDPDALRSELLDEYFGRVERRRARAPSCAEPTRYAAKGRVRDARCGRC